MKLELNDELVELMKANHVKGFEVENPNPFLPVIMTEVKPHYRTLKIINWETNTITDEDLDANLAEEDEYDEGYENAKFSHSIIYQYKFIPFTQFYYTGLYLHYKSETYPLVFISSTNRSVAVDKPRITLFRLNTFLQPTIICWGDVMPENNPKDVIDKFWNSVFYKIDYDGLDDTIHKEIEGFRIIDGA